MVLVPSAAITVAVRLAVHGLFASPGLHNHTCWSGVVGGGRVVAVDDGAVAAEGFAAWDDDELQAASVTTAAIKLNAAVRVMSSPFRVLGNCIV